MPMNARNTKDYVNHLTYIFSAQSWARHRGLQYHYRPLLQQELPLRMPFGCPYSRTLCGALSIELDRLLLEQAGAPQKTAW